jgi:hypothetical protein
MSTDDVNTESKGSWFMTCPMHHLSLVSMDAGAVFGIWLFF